jgi:uncharacterized protein YqgV (UPF0045/DUF77 family)
VQDHELEFTIEPFVEGHPGRHVRAAVEAVEALGVDVEFGPFGSSCRTPAGTMPAVVSAIVEHAFANGATHVSLHVAAGPAAPADDGIEPSGEDGNADGRP